MNRIPALGGLIIALCLAPQDLAQDLSYRTTYPVEVPASYQVAPQYVPTSALTADGTSLPAESSPYFQGATSLNSPNSFPSFANRPSAASTSQPDTYIDLEYLLWGLGEVNLPRLLTANPLNTNLNNIANSNDATTQTLLGNEPVGATAQSGMRLRLGRVYCGGLLSRLEFNGLFLFDASETWRFNSADQASILARPFIERSTGLPDAQILGMPGVADGALDAHYKRRLYAFDPSLFTCLAGHGNTAWEALAGYRFTRLEDQLSLVEYVRPQPGGLIAPGTEIRVEDAIRATNSYHTIPLGIGYVTQRDAWRLDARGIIALGMVHQELSYRGRTDVTVGSVNVSSNSGGFLTTPPYLGTFDQTRFAWIPEFNVNLRRCVRGGLWVHAGYSILFLQNAISVADHIPTTVESGLLAPAIVAQDGTEPRFEPNDIWVHGLNTGLQWNY